MDTQPMSVSVKGTDATQKSGNNQGILGCVKGAIVTFQKKEFSLEGEVDADLGQVLVEGLQAHLVLVLQSLVELMVPVLTPSLHVT